MLQIIGLVQNMTHLECPHCHQSLQLYRSGPTGGIKSITEGLSVPLLVEIPIEPIVSECSDAGIPIVSHASPSKSSLEYLKLCRIIADRLGI